MPESYEVICADQILRDFRQLYAEASQTGVAAEFLQAAEKIIQRFRTDPSNFGEHLYTLTSLSLAIRAAVVPPLLVHFGVEEERKLVIIQKFQLLTTRD